MQRDLGIFEGKAPPTNAYGVGGYSPNMGDYSPNMGGYYSYGIPAAPAFGATLAGTTPDFPCPLNGFEFQPFENCPRNFIIFDQTDNKSRVMFHPALAQKFSCTQFDVCGTSAHDAGKNTDKSIEHDDNIPSYKEDTEDINALLSSEEDEEDDVISTGRTPGSWGGSSPDSSCSTESSKSHEMNFNFQRSFSSRTISSERKRVRMRKMVRALRKIVPGGDQMDTPAVLDEAVRYLKSLKTEMEELGIQNFKN